MEKPKQVKIRLAKKRSCFKKDKTLINYNTTTYDAFIKESGITISVGKYSFGSKIWSNGFFKISYKNGKFNFYRTSKGSVRIANPNELYLFPINGQRKLKKLLISFCKERNINVNSRYKLPELVMSLCYPGVVPLLKRKIIPKNFNHQLKKNNKCIDLISKFSNPIYIVDTLDILNTIRYIRNNKDFNCDLNFLTKLCCYKQKEKCKIIRKNKKIFKTWSLESLINLFFINDITYLTKIPNIHSSNISDLSNKFYLDGVKLRNIL